MRLKRLELFGFKSFADRMVLDFADHTLTGIVGPNGCGKSNVVDSVRWVLGEMRPTSMRGEGMIDVIFKGSASRPPLGVAEVTLVLDNEDGTIEGRGPEVAIQRRLYRSGEGEYRIDGERVRLKDLRDMLYDTGLGSRGYSVLEQGRIDAVLSANPLQRRAIFEEAAGISRYRQRRHEAELRLKRVEQDVLRLEDVMGELRTRVRSLKIQAGKAERWVQIKDEWTRERTRLFRHKHARWSEELGALGPRLAEIEEDWNRLRAERGACEEEMRAKEEERAQVVGELHRLSGEAARLEGEGRAIEERGRQLSLRIQAWDQAAGEEEERGRLCEAQLQERRSEGEELAHDIQTSGAALEAAESSAANLAGELRELNRRYREVRTAVQEQNEAVLGCLHRRTAAQNRERHLSDSRQPASERAEKARAKLLQLDASRAAIEREAEAAEIEREQALARMHAIEDERVAKSSELAEVEGAWELLRSERAQAELERTRLLSRAESLLDRETERADLQQGTRTVLDAIEAGDGPCGASALQGLVADVLRTDTSLAHALDAVLSARAEALVAEDAHTAEAVVAWLRERGGGQVGVVLPSGLTARGMRPIPECGHGILGRLYDFVRCAKGCEPLGRALLGDVVVVEDVARAIELVQLYPCWRFVTTAGELVDAAGLVGGHAELVQSPVGRRSSAAELQSQAEQHQAALQEHERSLAEVGAQREHLRAQLVEIAGLREAASRELSAAEGRAATARARFQDLEQGYGQARADCGEAEAEVERLARELAVAEGERAETEASFQAENARLAEMEAGRKALEDEREHLARDEGRAQIETTRLKSELASQGRRAEELRRRIGELEVELERAARRAEEHRQSASAGRLDVEALQHSGAELAAARAGVESELVGLRERERERRGELEAVRVRMEAAQRRCDERSSELGQARLVAQRLELSLAEVQKRAAEELALDQVALSEAFEREAELEEDAALAALEAHTSELKSQLEKIGPVNMEAVHELAEVSGRLDHLEGQSGDLARAKARLAETIQKIDEESRRLFLQTFEEVREHFQRIFRQLFGGGKAELILEEGADVLEAGIDISARPPGREMLPISLLSGGQRTMTALALLFAVFQARPSPFCVLDEVDAALDDANVERFLMMLDGFRGQTQFIVVTHNKGTMAACQALFGVTMEVKGVSRFVTVELSDVDRFVPPEERTPPPAEEAPTGSRAVDPESGERLVELQPARGRSVAAEAPQESGVDSGLLSPSE